MISVLDSDESELELMLEARVVRYRTSLKSSFMTSGELISSLLSLLEISLDDVSEEFSESSSLEISSRPLAFFNISKISFLVAPSKRDLPMPGGRVRACLSFSCFGTNRLLGWLDIVFDKTLLL